MSYAPYGLGLNETIFPQYLKELDYATHIIGKVLDILSLKCVCCMFV